MDIVSLWEKTLQLIKGEVSTASFNAFFKEIKPLKQISNELIFLAPNEFIQNILENRYLNLIESCVSELSLKKYQIKFILDEKEIQDTTEEDKSNTIKKSYPNLNPKYTFDTFVIGNSNRFAHAACVAVAESPAKAYNPLFLYGGVGLGKTHLMHAIGNYIVTHSDKKVLYITAEQFTNDYRAIINAKSKYDNNVSYLEAFRDKYRNIDVLMIDDIQFLENATKSQKEFTNTFNTLYDNEKQIIIASDTSINDYKYLEDRLKTRFRWGLTESINPPELELKKNIIKNKIMINDFDLDINESVIDYIANNCGSDIRNLEGAVIRIVAYKAAFNIKNVTLEIAQEALQEFVPKTVYRTNSVAKIIDIVAKYFNLDASMLKGKMKKKNITDARAIAMYLSRIMTDESLQRIGLEFGGRDHSTVIYSHEKISKELKTNIKLQEEIKILKEKICE